MRDTSHLIGKPDMTRLLTVITLLCLSIGIYAQDSSAFDLLLDRLIKLEQRVKTLEEGKVTQSSRPAASKINTNLASDVVAWRRNVKVGMTMQQIRSVYGEPVKRSVSDTIAY